jgi:glycosyltransferase involved in cell wall biosynthesis
MKILMTVHHALERNAGAPGVTLRLAEEFRRLGHEAEVASFDDLPVRLPAIAQAILFPYLVAGRVTREHDKWDVVDASTGDTWLYSSMPRMRGQPLLVCRSHGLEHLAHDQRLEEVRRGMHRLSWKYPLYHGGVRLWEVRRSVRNSDLILVLNKEDYRYAAARLAVAEEKIRVVQNGIPDNFLGQPFRPYYKRSGLPLTIAQIGRYSAMKGVAYGSRALNNVLRRHEEVRVHLLGTMTSAATVLGDFYPDVRQRVEVTPHYLHEELPRLLSECQIKLFPTLTEGFGTALIEAMACGLAPVTTAAAGPRMIVVDHENGLLVPPGDSTALERALERLIVDPELLAALRRRALADAQAYSWRRIAREQLALFDEFRGKRFAKDERRMA